MTAELNEKLAILAGYKRCECGENGEVCKYWIAPGKSEEDGVYLPDYTHDLTACFRDIKPLLRAKGIDDIDFVYRDDGTVICFLSKEDEADLWSGEADPETNKDAEALAFCEAAIKFLSEVR
jgi:hypothetical protein